MRVEAGGITYTALVNRIAELAVERRAKGNA